jgi:hypothetical protein
MFMIHLPSLQVFRLLQTKLTCEYQGATPTSFLRELLMQAAQVRPVRLLDWAHTPVAPAEASAVLKL